MKPPQSQPIFERWWRDNAGRLRAVARAYAWEDPDDLLQEIGLQLWRSVPHFREQCSPRTWVYRVAINTSLQWRRTIARRKKHVPVTTMGTKMGQSPGRGGDADGMSEEALLATIEQAAAPADSPDPSVVLDKFLASLGDRDRGLLLMYLDDLPQDEIAAVMGVADATVRVQLHRLEKKFLDWREGE